MKRFLLKFIVSMGVALCVTIVAYVCFVYPDDARVPDLIADPVDTVPIEFVGSVLNSRLLHSIDIDDKSYTESVMQFQISSDYNVIPKSSRFTSKYQILVSTGLYPWRLEAADGIAIPAGHTLSIDVPDGADRLELLVPAEMTNQVSISSDDVNPEKLRSDYVTHFSNWPRFLARLIDKYFFIGSYGKLPRWLNYRRVLSKIGTKKLSIKCEAGGPICIVGDPKFYRPSLKKIPRQTIMVLIDTLRSDAVNLQTMPSLARLANESINFSRTIAPGNMTSPSTNGVLACQTPTELGAVAFAYTVGSENSEKFYKNSRASFPARLKAEGILTAMIGNISVVSDIYGVGVNHGFEHQILTESEGYETPLAISEAIRWLGENRNKDFFLYVHLNNPHAPYKAPVKYIKGQFQGLDDFISYPALLKWLYRGEVAFADFQVGRLLGFLNDQGLKKQVNIVITSDHGDQHSNRSFSGNQIAQDFTGTYFDHGATLYNDEIQVPLILRKVDAVPKVVTDFVSSLWIGKTILGLNYVSKKIAEECAGEDLAAVADGQVKKLTVLGTEGFHARALLFDGRYKYIRTYDPTEKRIYSADKIFGIKKSFFKKEQLFDLQKDPGESVDLAKDRLELLEQARFLFRQYFQITSAYELVLESGGSNTFEIESGNFASRRSGGIDGVKNLTEAKERLSGKFSDRIGIRFTFDPQMTLPWVLINGAAVPVRLTTLKLPTSGMVGVLPEETFSWVRSTPGPSAYIVRVLDERRKDRKIALGNPAFEKVLREWGYINEN